LPPTRSSAGPALQAAGARFLARGTAAKAYEAGLLQRTVLIEFASVDAAVAAPRQPGLPEALRALARAPSATCASSKGVE